MKTDTARELLDAALFALNVIPNHRIQDGTYGTTYRLAAAIESHLATLR